MTPTDIPNAIQTEMKTVEAMIRMSCRDWHGTETLCPECAPLKEYALLRLTYCQFGADKPTCVKCPVHCYKPDMKERIQAVMRHAGPKMLFWHPWLALIHLWKEHRPSFRFLSKSA